MSLNNQLEDLAKEIFEICLKNEKNAISDEDAIQCLQKVLGTLSTKESASYLFDVLEMVDVAVSSLPIDSEPRRRISALLKKCSDGIIPEDVVKVNVESVGEDSTLGQRFVKMKTKLFFKQLKFNLLREESEGYAKLITELSLHDDDISPQDTLNRVRCLIGQFNVDPNRAFDIVLECFESALDGISPSTDIVQSRIVSFYIELLKAYSPDSDDLCHIIGFKFTFYTAKRAAAAAINAPTSLYTLAAVLISHGMMDIVELCTYLSPKVDTLMAEQKEALDMANARCKTLSTSALGPEWDPAESNTDEATGNGEQTTSFANQKIGLTQALLRLNAWKEAKYLLDRLPEYYAVRHIAVSKSLCQLISSMLDETYKKFCPQHCIALGDIESESQTDNVPSLAVFVKDVLPIAAYLGPHLSVDPVLMAKLIRLCIVACAKVSSPGDAEEYDTAPIIDACEDVFLPSLGRLRSNCPIAEELWTLISQFPYTTRFRMYGRLKGEHEKRHPMLIIARGETIARARYIMKRVSKETTKTAGRQLGKLSHSCATSVFDYILNQIQQFENLIGPVVDSLKYLTNLSYDALAFCIIEHLSSPEKEKLKVSDATLSPWLQSLATFVGSVCKKYNIELTGILQYVANQLKNGKSFDLLVLREIIENMSGVETTTGLTRDQLEALTGGDTLRAEAGNFGQIRNTKRSSNRLKDALMQQDLVVSLCILMGQQRGCIVFDEGARLHLKLAGQMLDQCQETLVQFGNFLATSLKAEDYIKRMPPAPDLISIYHLSPETAMFLSRPAYTYKVLAKYEEMKKLDRSNKVNLTPDRKVQHYKMAYETFLDPLTKDLAGVFPPSTWQDMGARLFCTFWLLTMYDLNVPTAAYEREIDRVKKLAQQLDESREGSDAKRRKEKERYQQLESKLADEQRKQHEHVERVMAQLMDERQGWFPSKAARNASVGQFLQLCLLPRVYFSDADALYAAKFIHTIHRIKTPSFSTLICYDRVFCDIAPILFSLSENEANHYGRFLCAALETVMHWHKDQETFDKECTNFPGFITRFRHAATEESARDVVDFENFRHVVHKWHFKLTKILPQYPAVKQFSQAIEKKVLSIRNEEKDKRQDLHVLAASYWGHLKVRKAPEIMESEFNAMPQKEKGRAVALAADAKGRSAAGKTPEGSTGTTAITSALAASSSSELIKSKMENGVSSGIAAVVAAASPSKQASASNANTSVPKVTLRKDNKPVSAGQSTTDKIVAASDPGTGNVKRTSDTTITDRKSKQPSQKTTTAPSSPALSASGTINGGSTKTSSTQQQTIPESEPKAKRSKKSTEMDTGMDGASASGKSQHQTAAVDGSPKRASSKKTAEKPEEAEPRSKRRKIEDQSPRIEKKDKTPPTTTSSVTHQRREGSSERSRHLAIGTSQGLDKESKERDKDRGEKMPRVSSHVSLSGERHEKRTGEPSKRERSPKMSSQTSASSALALKKKEEGNDIRHAQVQERGGGFTNEDRRKVRLSSSSSRQVSSTTGSMDRAKPANATRTREEERRSSRGRKD